MQGVRLPLDLTQIPPFREIKNAMGCGDAHALWWELWRELAYHCQEGVTLGRLPSGALPGFKSALAEQGLDPEKSLETLVRSKLLVVDDEGYQCPRFALLNADLKSSGRERIGAYMKQFHGRQKKLEATVLRQATLISEHKFVDEDGNPLGYEEVRKVQRLIVSCDNALFKPERLSPAFTEGLIQSALRVARKYSDDEINQILRTVAYKRDHPALNGMTTERLLPVFGELLMKLT